MFSLRVALTVAAVAVVADSPSTLRVIRTTPSPEAGPTTTISVSFDRPVAGSLDQSVDPRTVVTTEPAIAGILEWRDPVTIRLTPTESLSPGVSYTVTVRPTFAALDGSRLAEPYRFTFRVTGPEILAGDPVGPSDQPRFLGPEPTFRLVTSAPVDSLTLVRLAYLELDAACQRPGTIRLRLIDQRTINDSMPGQFKEAGGWDRDRSADGLRRVVSLAPTRPLPLGCHGALVLPGYLDQAALGTVRRWPFATYGALRIEQALCDGGERACPVGPVQLRFTTPVRGAEVLRRVTLLPATKFTLADTNAVDANWTLSADLKVRTGYLIDVDPAMTDVFGQRLEGNPRATVVTTGYQPEVSYLSGRLTVERVGPRTLPVTHVNVDTLEVIAAQVPESLEARFLARSWYSWGDDWGPLSAKAAHRKIAVKAPPDRHGVFGVPIDPPVGGGLVAVKVTSGRLARLARETGNPGDDGQPIALIQVTDLGIHAKIGPVDGVVWVTGVSDGKPRAGATVRVRDGNRRLLGQGITDSQGIIRFGSLKRVAPKASQADESDAADGSYVEARLGADRAVIGITDYDPDLSPWQFNVSGAWGTERLPAAAAVFTERGIYRPGDSVFAKAIVRVGPLGSLKVPARTDSVRLVFQDRDEGTLREIVTVLSTFGTTAARLKLPADAPLGSYSVTIGLKRQGAWKELGRSEYRVAEYRPPEFLVSVSADTAAKAAGDTLIATVDARYLFGAPMARAKATWSVRQKVVDPWELDVPNTDGFFLTARGWWWEEYQNRSGTSVSEARIDSLDGKGQLRVAAPLVLANPALPARISLEAVVTDVNRQSVFGTASVMVHPTSFYLGAKPTSASYFWTAGTAERVDLIAVRPTGRRVGGVATHGFLIRREWHQVRRETDGYAALTGEWVSDTVDRCVTKVETAGSGCRFTPKLPGSYTVAFAAQDEQGREVSTSFYRWVTGPGWVPWADESQFKMDVIPDRGRYSIGDTATVLFASPFTNAEAWITIEREGVLAQQRLHLTDGATTLKLPVTEAWAPNAFISIVVARGRSAKPGPLDDPGRPTIRVGYAEVRVTAERKRLTVTLAADKAEYRPRDRAQITATVRDQAKGAKSEVAIWAVDEGVLSLTGYRTPDPIDLLYQPRGLGLRLGSNMATVAPQVAPGQKGRNPGGGGGQGASEVLRSRFKTTAFFVATVLTDSLGVGRVAVELPDNLTTFRLMAVAVTAGDRYGSGHSPMLVTRPLLARPALPRFARPGDQFIAGVVVNQRAGGTPTVTVKSTATGVSLDGSATKTAALEQGKGREVRFGFKAEPGDSAAFRFDVEGSGDRDAVRLAIPIRPVMRPRIATIAGVVRDSTTVTLDILPNADPARSVVSMNLGSSPIALLKGYADDLRIYPYFCSEQVSTVASPLIALFRARKQAGAEAGDTVRLKAEIERGVAMLVRRQRDDGAIGLWDARDWSSPWLSAEAGVVLLEAKAAGIRIRDSVFAGIAGYLTSSLARQENLALSVSLWDSERRVDLGERIAVADYLSRAGRRNRSVENELLRQASALAPVDRMQLAIILARGEDRPTARRLLEPIWQVTQLEGRTATLPDSLVSRSYFASTVRAPAALLLATLAVDPNHRLLAPLLETVVSRGRSVGRATWWNTQDFASAVRAVDAWQRRFPPSDRQRLRFKVAGKVIFATEVGRAASDSAVSLAALLGNRAPGPVPITIETDGTGAPGFFYLTLSEFPRTAAVNPEDHGIRVERWYEDYLTKKPTTSVTEGDLVRVRLRITVPTDRAFVVLDDPLPAGLEAIDLSLKTVGGVAGPGAAPETQSDEDSGSERWYFGSWDSGWWSPFDHKELRDDRVVYSARSLWPGTYSASYLARATTPGTFAKPQAHAEEMYNPGVYGRSDGGSFVVKQKTP